MDGSTIIWPELIVEIIRRYTGPLMTLLLVSKTVARVTLDNLVRLYDMANYDHTQILAPPCNVYELNVQESDYDLTKLNPVVLNICSRGSFSGTLTRLTSLTLYGTITSNEQLSMFTTLTYLDIKANDTITSVSTLTKLSTLKLDRTIDISMLALKTLVINDAHVPLISCTTLQELYFKGVQHTPILAAGISLKTLVMYDRDVPTEYTACTRQLTSLHVSSRLPRGFLAQLQLRELMLYGSQHATNWDAIGTMTQLEELRVNRGRLGPMFACSLTTLKLIDNNFWLRDHKTMLTALTTLDVYSNDLSDDVLCSFTTLTSLALRSYSLGGSPITNCGLATLTRLQNLAIETNTYVTIDGITHLNNLRYAIFTGTRIKRHELIRCRNLDYDKSGAS